MTVNALGEGSGATHIVAGYEPFPQCVIIMHLLHDRASPNERQNERAKSSAMRSQTAMLRQGTFHHNLKRLKEYSPTLKCSTMLNQNLKQLCFNHHGLQQEATHAQSTAN